MFIDQKINVREDGDTITMTMATDTFKTVRLMMGVKDGEAIDAPPPEKKEKTAEEIAADAEAKTQAKAARLAEKEEGEGREGAAEGGQDRHQSRAEEGRAKGQGRGSQARPEVRLQNWTKGKALKQAESSSGPCRHSNRRNSSEGRYEATDRDRGRGRLRGPDVRGNRPRHAGRRHGERAPSRRERLTSRAKPGAPYKVPPAAPDHRIHAIPMRRPPSRSCQAIEDLFNRSPRETPPSPAPIPTREPATPPAVAAPPQPSEEAPAGPALPARTPEWEAMLTKSPHATDITISIGPIHPVNAVLESFSDPTLGRKLLRADGTIEDLPPWQSHHGRVIYLTVEQATVLARTHPMIPITAPGTIGGLYQFTNPISGIVR